MVLHRAALNLFVWGPPLAILAPPLLQASQELMWAQSSAGLFASIDTHSMAKPTLPSQEFDWQQQLLWEDRDGRRAALDGHSAGLSLRSKCLREGTARECIKVKKKKRCLYIYFNILFSSSLGVLNANLNGSADWQFRQAASRLQQYLKLVKSLIPACVEW